MSPPAGCTISVERRVPRIRVVRIVYTMPSGQSEEQNPHRMPACREWGGGIAIGVAIGVALGIAMHNLGAGIAIGVGIGIAFATAFNASGKQRRTGGGDESA